MKTTKQKERVSRMSLDYYLDHKYFVPIMTTIFYAFPLLGLSSLLTSSTSYFIGTWLFSKAVAASYLTAFLSLWVQVLPMIGSKGLLPIAQTLSDIKKETRPVSSLQRENSIFSRFLRTPTLFWLNSSDLFLHLLCFIGTLSSILLLITPTSSMPFIAQPTLITIQYICYLSIFHVSGTFLSLQWDILLMETSYVSFFLSLLSSDSFDIPHRLALYSVHFLLYKLMFSSGIVKITSRDPNWKNLNAMNYHYNTQPLPNRLSPYIHHLSSSVHKIETLGTFITEILAPLMIWISFGGYFLGIFSIKVLSGLSFILLNLVISATGNYGFFNFLYISLCLSLLDDTFLGFTVTSPQSPVVDAAYPFLYVARLILALGSLAIPLVLSFPCYLRALRVNTSDYCSKEFLKFFYNIHQFHFCNSYGLFASMTTKRYEIVLEGSHDGKKWEEYDFWYKPGDVSRPPVTIPGHMPRVDWAMWFQALKRYPNVSPWFFRLLNEVLAGNTTILKLFRVNPFEDHPPKLLRAVLYEYHLANPYVAPLPTVETLEQEEKRGNDSQHHQADTQRRAYWVRSNHGLFIPGPLTLHYFKPNST